MGGLAGWNAVFRNTRRMPQTTLDEWGRATNTYGERSLAYLDAEERIAAGKPDPRSPEERQRGREAVSADRKRLLAELRRLKKAGLARYEEQGKRLGSLRFRLTPPRAYLDAHAKSSPDQGPRPSKG